MVSAALLAAPPSEAARLRRSSLADEKAISDDENNAESYIGRWIKERGLTPEKDVKVIDKVAEYYKNEKNRLIHMLQYASTRLRELENDVEKYIDRHGR